MNHVDYTRPLALVFIMIMLIVAYPSLNAELHASLDAGNAMQNAILIIAPITIWLAVLSCGVVASYIVVEGR